jgi:2-amino-4-hydroxy-6-hydroxymethyldihydropteridine diphosphokinase
VTICYLGLGSNLRSPKRQLQQAIASIKRIPCSRTLKLSHFYKSAPLGIRSQPIYYNLVIALQTSLPVHVLLRHCQSIEKKQQRIRRQKWAARTLDIDLLLFGELVLKKLNLTIPHPQMLTRDFVLIPLLEIAPSIFYPKGALISTYLQDCKQYTHST